jgi:hypothetical protein
MTNKKYLYKDKISGFTLVELMITVTITLLIVPILTLLFISTNKNFIFFEASSTLKQINQNSINRIYVRIGRNKKIFENTIEDNAFLARVDLTGCYSVATGSKLSITNPSGSFSPASANFDTASFGNSLFFAYNIAPAILENIEKDASGVETQSVRVDLYRFLYYYLTPDDAPVFAGRQSYKITEWESQIYADCEQIQRISDDAKRSNVINALVGAGHTYCLDTSQADVSNAFYELSAGALSLEPNHTIVENKCQILTKILTGILSGGYSYGVSPNNVGMSGGISHSVPLYTTISGNFPAGLEVGVVGLSAGRRVLIRSVLIAQTGVNSYLTKDISIISSSRDIW